MARHSETLEELVVYRNPRGDGGLWARRGVMFEGDVEAGGRRVRRFEFLRPGA